MKCKKQLFYKYGNIYLRLNHCIQLNVYHRKLRFVMLLLYKQILYEHTVSADPYKYIIVYNITLSTNIMYNIII